MTTGVDKIKFYFPNWEFAFESLWEMDYNVLLGFKKYIKPEKVHLIFF